MARTQWLGENNRELAKIMLERRKKNHPAHSTQLLYAFIGRTNDFPLEQRIEAGLQLLEDESPERRAIIRAKIITEFLPQHTELLYNYLSRDDLSPQEFAAGGGALAEYHGFDKALAWAKKLPFDQGGEDALKGVATKWVEHDLIEASEGVLAEQPGTARDALIEGMVDFLVRKKRMTEDARKLLPSVQDETKRTALEKTIGGKS